MKINFPSFLLLMIPLFGACTKKIKPPSDGKSSMSEKERTILVAQQLFKQDYEIDYNPSQTLALISKKIKSRPNEVFPTLSFLVYDPQKEEIIYKETVARATIKWINDEEIEVAVVPGRDGGPEQIKPGFIYHVKTQQKRNR